MEKSGRPSSAPGPTCTPWAAPAGVTVSVSAQPSVWQMRVGGRYPQDSLSWPWSVAPPPLRAEGT